MSMMQYAFRSYGRALAVATAGRRMLRRPSTSALIASLALVALVACGERSKSGASLAAAAPATPVAADAAALAEGASPVVATAQANAPAAPEANAAAVPKASEHSAEEPLDTGRMRQQPRKKAGKVHVDLDGDGKDETLTIDQTPAADDWRGEPEKAPVFVAKILRADGSVALESKIPGIATGWMRLPLRLASGRHAIFLVWSKPDVSTPLALVARWVDGKAVLEPTAHLPLFHWDWQGKGVEAVVGISEELWQDFLRTGTTSVTDLSAAEPRNLLPFVAFEVCLADSEQAKGAAGLDLFAVARDGHKLHALRVDADGQYQSVGSVAVSAPDDGSRWSVPSGFALACLGGHRVQYKSDTFRFANGRFKAEGSRARPH